MTNNEHPITPPPELMTDTTRNLIIKLSSHMAYMQGQLEAHHELDDLEDYYWYRESVALRQQVADALAADEPAVPEGREPASVTGEPSDEELLKVAGQAAHIDDILDALEVGYPLELTPVDIVDICRAVIARLGRPAPVPVSERLPEPSTKVLAHYFNDLGKGRTICAIWVPAKSRSDEGDLDRDDFLEYDEEGDKYYWPEGWYEAIENWEELGWVKVDEGEVVYWQPLPKWPAMPLPVGEVE